MGHIPCEKVIVSRHYSLGTKIRDVKSDSLGLTSFFCDY